MSLTKIRYASKITFCTSITPQLSERADADACLSTLHTARGVAKEEAMLLEEGDCFQS